MNKFINDNPVKVLLLVFVFLHSIYNVMFNVTPYPTGYCAEYMLTTEAIINHGSADIRVTDIENFKADYLVNDAWDSTIASTYFDGYTTYLKQDTLQFDDAYKGVYTARNNKQYASHLTTWAYLNVPARLLIKALAQNPMYSIPLTNVLCIVLAFAVLLFVGNYSLLTHCVGGVLFLCSAIMWYSGWLGAEAFIMSCVVAGLWLYLHNHWHWAIAIIALAASQELSLVIMLIPLTINALIATKFNKKTSVIIALSLVVVALAMVNYYNKFSTLNVLSYAGYSTWQLISGARVFSLFFDLNQGILITLPLALLVYVVLWIKHSINYATKKTPFSFNLLLPIAILALAIVISTSVNWNNEQNVISTYATVISSAVLIHCWYWVTNLQLNTTYTTLLQIVLLISQVATTLNHSVLKNPAKGDGTIFKPMAEWAMLNYNDWYNPDPEIFVTRATKGKPQVAQTVVSYLTTDFELYKIAVDMNKLNDLKLIGFNDTQINTIKPYIIKAGYQISNVASTTATANYLYNNWGYINRKDILLQLDSATIAHIEARYVIIKYINDLQQLITQMRNNPTIYEQVLQKANERKASPEGVLVADAIWILPTPSKAMEAQQLINKIINTSEIYAGIVQKSIERKAPEGDVVIADAKYIMGLPQ